jgi:hypothetical protein
MIYLWNLQLLSATAFVFIIAVVYVLACVLDEFDKQKERRKKRNG